MSHITIEGCMNKHLSIDDLAAAYSMDVRIAPTGLKGLFDRSRIYAELLLIPEVFASFRFYSKLYFSHYGKIDEKEALLDGKDRFPGRFLQTYNIDKLADNIVRWDIGGSFGGFAIEDLQVETVTKSGSSELLESRYFKGDGVLIDRYWVFLSSTAHMLFSLPEKLPDEIRISGFVLAPMPRRVLRAVIYADCVENTNDEAGDDNEANKKEINVKDSKRKKIRSSLINTNKLRFAISLIKRGIKKYGVFGVVKEVAKRLFRL